MRKIIAYFAQFPIAANVFLLAIFVLGLNGFSLLNFSRFPQLATTIITIDIAYPGTAPREIEEGIVLKIEDNLKGVIGIDKVTSTSTENQAKITVECLKGYDINEMVQEVKNAVDRVPSFPVDMEPPIITKQAQLHEVVSMVLSGEGISLRALKEIAYQVEDEIRDMEGISQLVINGFPAEEIEIAVRKEDLRAQQLTFSEVTNAVAQSNILTTGGNIKTETEDYLIRANNRSYFGADLNNLVVRSSPTGKATYLKDVATVSDKWSENPNRIYYNDKPAIAIRLFTTNQEDFIDAAAKIKAYQEQFNAQRKQIQLHITADSSIDLRERMRILSENGLMGILLVLIVLSLFLQPRLAFWVAIGLPFSFLGMFMVVPGWITLNTMSLFGMIVVIGILVDDSIVIGENIYAHYQMGKTPVQAAIDGTMEVATAIVSAILTTVIAFATFFFVGGRFGDFYYDVSIVVVATLLFSLIEALIILPAHLANSKALQKGVQRNLVNRWADKGINWLKDRIYAPILHFFLTYRFFALALPISFFILTIGGLVGGHIGLTFFPAISSDKINIELRMPEGTSENITATIAKNIENAAWVVNDSLQAHQTGSQSVIKNVVRKIGPGIANAALTINLLPGEERNFAAGEIANAIEATLGPIYGVENLTFNAGQSFGGKPISVSLTGNNIQELKGAKAALKSAFAANDRLKDITDNDPMGIKEIRLTLRDNAFLLGLSLNKVMEQVRAGFFGQSVQRFQRGREEIRVWVRYDETERKSIKNLDEMWIVTPTGERVPLATIANYTIERGEVAINHLNGKRAIQVEADLKDAGDNSADIMLAIQGNVMPQIQALYPTITPTYGGQSRNAKKAMGSIHSVMPIILFLMYAIIAFSFRSYTQPLLLFLLIPFSLVGVAWGHGIHGYPLSVLSILGIIALIGILVNDGLVLVSKYNVFLKQGLSVTEALYEAGRSRFRAILLTSITTIAGLTPLLFETARTAQFLIPMAITIAYGIGYATFLTLFILPVLLHYTSGSKH